MTTATVRRPGLVTLLVVLIVIGGVASIVSGIIAFIVAGLLALAAVILVAIGLIYLAVAKGLADGNRLSRTIVAVVAALQILFGVFSVFSSNVDQTRSSSIGSAVFGLIVLLILFSPKANAFFGSRSS